MSRKWFQNWFNSPYYHILYNQRDDAEAEYFIDNLCAYLKPDADARLLDIACGRGRHAVYLNKKGYDTVGIDLSVANVTYARQFENKHLHFFVHDMRRLFYINYFDFAFNLFTSFGYFDTKKDHINALKAFRKALKPDGVLVLDYFNTQKIVKNLSPQETKTIEGIDFYITKKVTGGKIIKTISFEHRNKDFAFKEEVAAFSMADFTELFELSGFYVQDYFGDYALNAYEPDQSDRLIFICKKTHA
ncbi:class I SAM-dependent methyltransferase [Pedobacter sp. BS3]|uniref:class I SAM-dependent methyltransferase n=1 Tax=Pedobacter sp. BS3 TaxID=2567937 RepID=UPI0011ED0E99|nr:class I SAM-dependent methyltransferase [Pedobacter sp. BS3]TZF82543.1 class I SAM-dependent methyltransferase [Pedobacter sp. BS3]